MVFLLNVVGAALGLTEKVDFCCGSSDSSSDEEEDGSEEEEDGLPESQDAVDSVFKLLMCNLECANGGYSE